MKSTTVDAKEHSLRRRRRWATPVNVLLAAFACLLLAAIMGLFNRHPRAFRDADFSSFYLGSRVVLEGSAESLYDIGLQRRIQEGIGDFDFKPYIHPPFELFLVLPLALLTYERAFWIWFALNFGSLLFLPFALARFGSPGLAQQRPMMAVAVLSFYPFYPCLLNGQDSILFLWILFWSYVLLKRKKEFFAGILLGFTFIKPQLAVLLLIPILIRRRGRCLQGLVLSGAVLLGGSFLCFGPAWIGSYRHLLGHVASHQNLQEPTKVVSRTNETEEVLRQLPRNMHNWVGQLTLFGFDGGHSLVGAFLLTLVALAISYSIWNGSWIDSPLFELRFAATILLAALASFHLYFYDLSIIFLALIFSLDFALRLGSPRSSKSVLALLIAMSPVIWLFPEIQYQSLVLKCTVVWMSSILLLLVLTLVKTRSEELFWK